MSLIGGGMGDHPKKNLGFIVLLQYILFDCLKLFVSFLLGGCSGHLVTIEESKTCLGTNMITCVTPYLQQEHIGHMLKNIIKVIILPKMISKRI